jgi:hypothetical protein
MEVNMLGRLVMLIALGTIVALIVACILSILPTAGMTPEQVRVLLWFLIILVAIVAVVLISR